MPKILLIEDDLIFAELLKRRLLEEGYELEAAYDGQQGFDRIAEVKPDVVFLDIMIPIYNGREVLQKIRQTPEYNTIPVIMLSNIDSQESINDLLSKGANGFIVKSEFAESKILLKLRELFPQKN